MLEIFLKASATFLTMTLTAVILGWLSRGSGNKRLYYIGGIGVLIGLLILGFDLTRKRYHESDYTTQEVTVKGCLLNDLNDGIIVAGDDAEYPFDRSLLRRAGSVSELAQLICHQKELKIWLNPGKEISAFENEEISIPLKIGIARDDGNHAFLGFSFAFGLAGLILMIGAYINDRKGRKIPFRG